MIEISMSRAALARHVGVAPQTLWNWQRRGALPPAERISGREVRFDHAAITVAEALAEASQ